MLNMELYFFIANTEAAIFLNIFQCPYEKKQILSSELNSINADYRYVKFYISSDNDIRATMDVLFTDFSVADILLTASIKFIDVVDECYPRIMKCVW